MELFLDDEIEKFVARKVASGEYREPVEVVHAALSLLKEQDEIDAMDLEELRKEIAVGIAQADRGETAPWTSEDIKAEGRKLQSVAPKRVI